MSNCVICGDDTENAVFLSRCCCDHDKICDACAVGASFSDYLAKASPGQYKDLTERRNAS